MQVGSFGVNGHVKLPGPTQQQPNVYNFGTPYQTIYNDLKSKDEGFYEQKGLLQVAALSFRACARFVISCMGIPVKWPAMAILTKLWHVASTVHSLEMAM